VRLLPLFAWAVISIYLARWLTPKVWPTQRINSMLFALLPGMGQAAVGAVRLASDRSLAAAIRRRWRGLSGPELFWMAVAICWLVAFSSVLLTDPGRARAAELPATTCCHRFRATGITVYLLNGWTVDVGQPYCLPEQPYPGFSFSRFADNASAHVLFFNKIHLS
jgi:hypothetical protein